MSGQPAHIAEYGKAEFLQDDFIRRYSAMTGMEDSLIEEIIQLKDSLLRNEPFIRKLEDWHERLFVREQPFGEVFPENPKLGTPLGDSLRGVFYYLLLLSGVPLMIRRYREQKWQDTLLHDMLRDFDIWARHHKRNFGTPGLAWMAVGWIHSQIFMKLVGFGRLQFNVSMKFPAEIMAFRNRVSGQVQTLFAGKKRFTTAGLLDDLQEEPAAGSWNSIWEETESCWRGNPVGADGFVRKEPAVLEKTEWELKLKYGDPVINIHIPESGPLTPEACLDSLYRVRDFFAEYFPDYAWKAFCCESWLLDPQLAGILPAKSNILAFQRGAYLVPFGGPADTVFRCFGVKGARDGVDSVQPQNSFQQALSRFLKDGGHFHTGAGFLLREDLGKNEPYRRKA